MKTIYFKLSQRNKNWHARSTYTQAGHIVFLSTNISEFDIYIGS